jgi:hypothetical protein
MSYCNYTIDILINLGSPLVEAKEINILTPSEEQSPCTPKTNSLSQLLDVKTKTITIIQEELT